MNQVVTDGVLDRNVKNATKAAANLRVTTRTVIVSNRVPSPTEKGATAGGLAVALADAATPGSLWFGWSGRRADETSSPTA